MSESVLLSYSFVRNRLIPIAAGFALSFTVACLLSWLLPGLVAPIMAVVFFATGFLAAWLTADEPGKDNKGNNGFVLLAGAWIGYIFFSRQLFPNALGISDWFFQVMGFNIINGFAIVLGAMGAAWLQKRQFR